MKTLGRQGGSPMIVAEMSANHGGSLDRAKKLVVAASRAGVDAVKLQTYTAETMTLDVKSNHFKIDERHPLWGGRYLHDLYNEAHTPWKWHRGIYETARDQGILAFSTPFDDTAVDFLESIDNPIYKIASIEICHLPLIAKVASTSKPLIISTGAAKLGEIEEAVHTARNNGADDITLMVFTSSYPANDIDSNLSRIPLLREKFGTKVGFSDHTKGIGSAIAAVALGADVIEKHFKLHAKETGVDSEFSVTPSELAQLVIECRNAHLALGSPEAWNLASESTSNDLRPSIHIAEDVAQGEIASAENLRICRPNGGLEPHVFSSLIGRKFSKSLTRGHPVQKSDLT